MKRLICCLVFALLVISSRAIGQEKKIQRSQLPPEVEQTVKTLSKTATIRGFSQEIGRGATYYEVELTVSNHRKDCLMDIKGNVVEVEEEVALASLPPSVQDGLEAMARGGKVQEVESITKQGKLVAYEADVRRDGKRWEVQVGGGLASRSPGWDRSEALAFLSLGARPLASFSGNLRQPPASPTPRRLHWLSERGISTVVLRSTNA
jgi:hypothetical protein